MGLPTLRSDTTTTDGDGNYVFDGLDPDLTYVVEFVAPDDRTFTGQDAGDDDLDSDGRPGDGYHRADRPRRRRERPDD